MTGVATKPSVGPVAWALDDAAALARSIRERADENPAWVRIKAKLLTAGMEAWEAQQLLRRLPCQAPRAVMITLRGEDATLLLQSATGWRDATSDDDERGALTHIVARLRLAMSQAIDVESRWTR